MSASNVWYGKGVADEGEFRLCGNVSGRRTIELGIGPVPAGTAPNAVTLAVAGAKSIAIDPSAERIADLRRAAEEHEVRVECHQGELADLGFATSGSVDLVVATQTLDDVDDLPRLLRQVHRVLRPDAAFVVSLTHPVAAMFDSGVDAPRHRYGSVARSIGELFMSFERSNFRLDVLHELSPMGARDALAPSVLLLRARKLGV
ncbi:MAG: class I SAM-dependent methyltransferase [Acidimicrobiales bacterium]